MLEMFEHAILENQFVAAFAVVGIIVWVSNFLAHHVTRGRVHGSAIAVLAGLALAYWGGMVTGKTKGLGDLAMFGGLALMGGAMMRDFCIVATASEVHVDEAKKAGWLGFIGLFLGTVLPFIVGVAVAMAFGYTDPVALAAYFDQPPEPAPPEADVLVIGPTTGPSTARRFVHDYAQAVGMSEGRLRNLRTAVQELVVNTVVHAGGSGILMIWTHGRQVVCQVQDGGRITDPLVGRRPPAPPEVGHGLFTVHQVCDLVRVHRRRDGTLVRIHVNFD